MVMSALGVFYQTVKIGNPVGGDMVEVEAMVDTGAIHSMFPASLLEHLQVEPMRNYTFSVADGSLVEYPYGEAMVQIDGEFRTCSVIFGPEDDALLGATTLENFNLIVDSVHQRLVPAEVLPLDWGGGGFRPR